jgi:hypothetical protein
VRLIAAERCDERWDSWGANATEGIFSRVLIGPTLERFNRLRGRCSWFLVSSLSDDSERTGLLRFAGCALGCGVYLGSVYFRSIAVSGCEDGRAAVGDLDFFMGTWGLARAANGSREAQENREKNGGAAHKINRS